MTVLREHEIPTSIYYTDLNIRDQIKMSALMRNFQEIGGRHLDAAGMPPEVLQSRNLAFMLIRHEIRLKAPIAAGNYRMSTWVTGTSGVNFIRNYEMADDAENKLVTASAAWIIYDMAAKKVIRPDRVETNIPPYPERISEITDTGRFKIPDGMERLGLICPRFTDMDSNRHVNNAVYADFAAEAAHLAGITAPIVCQKLYFRHECTAGESILLSAKREENRLFVCGESQADGNRSFEAELTFGL